MGTIPTPSKAMNEVRHSYDACRIKQATAMHRLIMLGLSMRNADAFLRYLPLIEQTKGGENAAR